jgi:hypothetical protein
MNACDFELLRFCVGGRDKNEMSRTFVVLTVSSTGS